MTNENITDARQGVKNENLDEVVNAAVSAAHAMQGGQNQFQTPDWLAGALCTLLPHGLADRWQRRAALDPQGASGNLVRAWRDSEGYVWDIDNRLKKKDGDEGESNEEGRQQSAVEYIIGNCVRIGQLFDDVYPQSKFPVILANPPFGIRWKTLKPDESTIESTAWTWAFIKARLADNGYGFIIANVETLRKLEVDKDPWVYLFQEFPAGGVWDNCNVRLGVAHFYAHRNWIRSTNCTYKVWETLPEPAEIRGLRSTIPFPSWLPFPYAAVHSAEFTLIRKIINEEKADRTKWNVTLRRDGKLSIYLSTYARVKMSRSDVEMLHAIEGCHPLTLTVEKERRMLLEKLLQCGAYTIQPEAEAAIRAALESVKSQAAPMRPVTDFEAVAYADENEFLECISDEPVAPGMRFVKGKKYGMRTSTYHFTEAFQKKVLTYGEDDESCWLEDHDMELHGQDRYIEVFDEHNHRWRFMDRPGRGVSWQLSEALLWKVFAKPEIKTIAETSPELYKANLATLEMHAMMSGFDYFPGQHGYIARIGCKDYALVAAETGTGKTLIALSLIQIKSPGRTLIIAPQGTMRSSGSEDEVDYQPSQWVTEIRRFAPAEPVFQLFSREDYRAILDANGGVLPPGVYITYPQALWMNGTREHIPDSWVRKNQEKVFCETLGLTFDPERGPNDWWSRNLGTEKNGIRCVATPSLCTTIEAEQGGEKAWDMVIIDEAHLCANPDSIVTGNLLRLQPKFRFALTATPIPNYVSNLFPLMGWLCVPGWHLGDVLNVAWPYTRRDEGRFKSTFMSIEVDKTEQRRAQQKGEKNWRNKGVKKSPIISAPARLLKVLKPNIAYISKEECNPEQVECEVTDVRVPMGKDQQVVYEHWLNRQNLAGEFKNPLVRALAQLQRLRGICGSPRSTDYAKINLGTAEAPKIFEVQSDFNSKTITILQLIRDRLREGEQVVVVSARCGQSGELQRRLSEANVPTARIDSTVPAEMHSAEANRFKRGDARVMFMGIKCAQGHSFDRCHNLIVASLEWSYGSLHQAKGRVWRLTSKKKVRVWCVLHENSIEELLFDRVATKQDAATICLRGQRVPRAFHQADASEVLAEHIVKYKSTDGRILSELECEGQWPELRKQLIAAYRPTTKVA